MNRPSVHSVLLRSSLLLASYLFVPARLLAQNPKLTPANLNYTKAAFTYNHLIAQVERRVGENKYIRFQYDHYPDLARIKTDDGVAYARPKGKAWLKSDDWGEPGARVRADKASELDADTKIAELPLQDAKFLDKTQGGTVWKLVDRKREETAEYFTYEQSREKPRPDGFYPRYTFVKYKNDSDGKLLLRHFAGQLRTDNGLVPVETQFDLMIQLPPGSVKVEIAPNPSKGGSKH